MPALAAGSGNFFPASGEGVVFYFDSARPPRIISGIYFRFRFLISIAGTPSLRSPLHLMQP
jgi:hypothetical protein